ncbi:ABC transporter permease subunit [Knoellia sp. CPCC 206453]|uniref:ABC transporter permease subunit n=1 Tax=Knoellia pratensis TaxID=3404796 RepID=UPI00362049FA
MGNAIKSEIRKIFTTRLWWGLAIGLAILAALISAGFAALVGVEGAGGPDDGNNPFGSMTIGTAQLIYNAGLIQNLTTLLPLALGVLLITSEYRHKTISSTLLATPKRSVVLLSKIAAVAVIGAVYAVIHAASSILGGALILTLVKNQPTMLGEPEVWRSLGVGVIAFILWILLGFGFGMLVRNQIAAVLLAVGVGFVAHIALNIIFGVLEWTTAAKFIPGNLTASMLVQSDPVAGGSSGPQPYFTWWVAGLILAGYALAMSIAGAWRMSRQDIS